nr:MAG TPA: hypothetical protein [Caudoviricetes sp.]
MLIYDLPLFDRDCPLFYPKCPAFALAVLADVLYNKLKHSESLYLYYITIGVECQGFCRFLYILPKKISKKRRSPIMANLLDVIIAQLRKMSRDQLYEIYIYIRRMKIK